MKFKIGKKRLINTFALSIIFTLMFSVMAFADDDAGSKVRLAMAWKTFFDEYKFQLGLFVAISIVSAMLAFIYNVTRIGVYSGNSDLRSDAIRNTLISAGCIMALGSITTIASLIYHITIFP